VPVPTPQPPCTLGVIKSRVLTGTYKTQHIISWYEKSTTSSICRLCQKDTEEDYVHFLLKCNTLSTIRYNHLVILALYLETIQVNTDYLVNSEKDLLQLIIDCGASNLIDSQYRKDVDTICRDTLYNLCSACEKNGTTIRVKSYCRSGF
jgi:hypothetical protein